MVRLCLKEIDPKIATVAVLTGNHAAQALDDRQFDFAIFETALPRISGFKLAAQAVSRNLPVLLMSGSLDGQAALRRFDFPHLAKPFGLSQVVQEVECLISAPADNLRCVRAALEKMHTRSPEVRQVTSQAA